MYRLELAKHLTTQNLTSNSPFWLIWNIATFVRDTNLHQNDLKIDNFCCFSACFGSSSFSQNAVVYYSAPINMINAISLSLHSRCN